MDFNAKTNPGRESRLQQLEEDKVWDVLIIGGVRPAPVLRLMPLLAVFPQCCLTRRTFPKVLPAVQPN